MNAQDSTKKIRNMIKQVSIAKNKFYNGVQACCVEIMCHTYHHGDWTLANDLINEFDKGVRKEGLVKWFVEFVGLEWKGGKFVSWNKDRDAIKDKLATAKETPWHSMAKEEKVEFYDANQAFVKFMNSYVKHKKAYDSMSDEDKAKTNLIVSLDVVQNFLVAANIDFTSMLIKDEIEKLEEHINEYNAA